MESAIFMDTGQAMPAGANTTITGTTTGTAIFANTTTTATMTAATITVMVTIMVTSTTSLKGVGTVPELPTGS